jgi:2'-5' RNA ligase
VRQAVTSLLRELRKLEPDQYYYTGSEFHITVLSLFTVTLNFEPSFAQKVHYLDAADAALNRARPIEIMFEGITASPSAIMISGFFETDELNKVRDNLRRELRLRGLAKGLDERYKLETAHMTVVRFRAPLGDPERFARALVRAQKRPFGSTTIRSLAVVENDWYMSHRTTVPLKRYSVRNRH